MCMCESGCFWLPIVSLPGQNCVCLLSGRSVPFGKPSWYALLICSTVC